MSRILLLVDEYGKQCRVTIPDDAFVTFGPFSPPRKDSNRYTNPNDLRGTLRIYEGKNNKGPMLGLFTGISSFRDMSKISFAQEVVREEGAVIWKDDEEGYVRENKQRAKKVWVDGPKVLRGENE